MDQVRSYFFFLLLPILIINTGVLATSPEASPSPFSGTTPAYLSPVTSKFQTTQLSDQPNKKSLSFSDGAKKTQSRDMTSESWAGLGQSSSMTPVLSTVINATRTVIFTAVPEDESTGSSAAAFSYSPVPSKSSKATRSSNTRSVTSSSVVSYAFFVSSVVPRGEAISSSNQFAKASTFIFTAESTARHSNSVESPTSIENSGTSSSTFTSVHVQSSVKSSSMPKSFTIAFHETSSVHLTSRSLRKSSSVSPSSSSKITDTKTSTIQQPSSAPSYLNAESISTSPVTFTSLPTSRLSASVPPFLSTMIADTKSPTITPSSLFGESSIVPFYSHAQSIPISAVTFTLSPALRKSSSVISSSGTKITGTKSSSITTSASLEEFRKVSPYSHFESALTGAAMSTSSPTIRESSSISGSSSSKIADKKSSTIQPSSSEPPYLHTESISTIPVTFTSLPISRMASSVPPSFSTMTADTKSSPIMPSASFGESSSVPFYSHTQSVPKSLVIFTSSPALRKSSSVLSSSRTEVTEAKSSPITTSASLTESSKVSSYSLPESTPKGAVTFSSSPTTQSSSVSSPSSSKIAVEKTLTIQLPSSVPSYLHTESISSSPVSFTPLRTLRLSSSVPKSLNTMISITPSAHFGESSSVPSYPHAQSAPASLVTFTLSPTLRKISSVPPFLRSKITDTKSSSSTASASLEQFSKVPPYSPSESTITRQSSSVSRSSRTMIADSKTSTNQQSSRAPSYSLAENAQSSLMIFTSSMILRQFNNVTPSPGTKIVTKTFTTKSSVILRQSWSIPSYSLGESASTSPVFFTSSPITRQPSSVNLSASNQFPLPPVHKSTSVRPSTSFTTSVTGFATVVSIPSPKMSKGSSLSWSVEIGTTRFMTLSSFQTPRKFTRIPRSLSADYASIRSETFPSSTRSRQSSSVPPSLSSKITARQSVTKSPSLFAEVTLNHTAPSASTSVPASYFAVKETVNSVNLAINQTTTRSSSPPSFLASLISVKFPQNVTAMSHFPSNILASFTSSNGTTGLVKFTTTQVFMSPGPLPSFIADSVSRFSKTSSISSLRETKSSTPLTKRQTAQRSMSPTSAFPSSSTLNTTDHTTISAGPSTRGSVSLSTVYARARSVNVTKRPIGMSSVLSTHTLPVFSVLNFTRDQTRKISSPSTSVLPSAVKVKTSFGSLPILQTKPSPGSLSSKISTSSGRSTSIPSLLRSKVVSHRSFTLQKPSQYTSERISSSARISSSSVKVSSSLLIQPIGMSSVPPTHTSPLFSVFNFTRDQTRRLSSPSTSVLPSAVKVKTSFGSLPILQTKPSPRSLSSRISTSGRHSTSVRSLLSSQVVSHRSFTLQKPSQYTSEGLSSSARISSSSVKVSSSLLIQTKSVLATTSVDIKIPPATSERSTSSSSTKQFSSFTPSSSIKIISPQFLTLQTTQTIPSTKQFAIVSFSRSTDILPPSFLSSFSTLASSSLTKIASTSSVTSVSSPSPGQRTRMSQSLSTGKELIRSMTSSKATTKQILRLSTRSTGFASTDISVTTSSLISKTSSFSKSLLPKSASSISDTSFQTRPKPTPSRSIGVTSTTTISPTTTKLEVRVKTFDVTLKIVNKYFNSSLGDKESKEFKELATEVQDNVYTTLKHLKGFRSSVVEKFLEANRVICQLKIFVLRDSNITQTKLKELLESSLGSLQFTVVKTEMSTTMVSTDKSTPTKPIVKTTTKKPTDDDVVFEVTARIPNTKYTNKLGDDSSLEFNILSENLTLVLTDIFKNGLPGFLSVVVISFRSGSIICTFEVRTKGESLVSEKQIKEVLTDASDSGEAVKYTFKDIEVKRKTARTTTGPYEIPTTKSTGKGVVFRVTVTLPNEEYTDELRDNSSEKFNKLSNELTDILTEIFKNKMPGFRRVVIISFRKGSIICVFKVIAEEDSKVSEDEVKDILTKANEDGKIGKYTFSKDIKVVQETKTPDVREVKGSDWPAWATAIIAVFGVLLLVIFLIIYVIYKKFKSRSEDLNNYGENIDLKGFNSASPSIYRRENEPDESTSFLSESKLEEKMQEE